MSGTVDPKQRSNGSLSIPRLPGSVERGSGGGSPFPGGSLITADSMMGSEVACLGRWQGMGSVGVPQPPYSKALPRGAPTIEPLDEQWTFVEHSWRAMEQGRMFLPECQARRAQQTQRWHRRRCRCDCPRGRNLANTVMLHSSFGTVLAWGFRYSRLGTPSPVTLLRSLGPIGMSQPRRHAEQVGMRFDLIWPSPLR